MAAVAERSALTARNYSLPRQEATESVTVTIPGGIPRGMRQCNHRQRGVKPTRIVRSRTMVEVRDKRQPLGDTPRNEQTSPVPVSVDTPDGRPSSVASRLSARITRSQSSVSNVSSKRTVTRLSRRSTYSPGPDEVSSSAHQGSEPGEQHASDEDDESRDVVGDALCSSPTAMSVGMSVTQGPVRKISEVDMMAVDITAENGGWDTDLEAEDMKESYDVSGHTVYMESCRKLGVIPASYFLRHMNDVTLDMKHHGLGPIGIRPLAVSLVSNTKVLTLNLNDNWLGDEGGMHLSDMLRENCYITHLDLSDNKLSSAFAERFAHVLNQNNTLTHIRLSGNELDAKSSVHMADIILNTVRLECLDLSHNNLGEIGGMVIGPAISENASLRSLDLSWNCIRRKGAVAIGQGIKQNVVLQKINLSWNGFSKDGAMALGDALKSNTSLETLDVSNNRFTTESAVLLAKGLAVNEILQVLKIGQNPMQSAGCYAVCAAILKNPACSIRNLDFSDILVNTDFFDIMKDVKSQYPDLKVKTGNDSLPKKPKVRVHPMVKLQNYITKHNLRLVDFFNRFDKDGSMSVTREEFAQGIEESGIKLTEEEVTVLLEDLDKDGDGEINYSELVLGHADFAEKEKKSTSILPLGGSSMDSGWK